MGKNTILYVLGKAKRLAWNSLSTALLCLSAAILSFSFVSCTDDIEGEDVQNGLNEMDGTSEVTMSFNLAATRSTLGEGYVAATDYENRIKDYRIYFFDTDNNSFISTFIPDKFSKVDSISYSVTGKLSEGLADSLSSSSIYDGKFKIVVIGNWEAYPEESDFTQGTTTIENLCTGAVGNSSDYAIFSCPKPDSLELDSVLIPVYGVHSYSDVTFIHGQTTVLEDTISMLKAMAKVEVVDSTISTRNFYYPTIKTAKIIHYNAKGYCAPAGVNSETDLTEDGYSKAVNLIGGVNDTQNEKTDTLDMFYDEEDGKWIAYVPEYSNSGDDKCSIEIMAQCIDEKNDSTYDYTEYLSNPYKLYFCEYDEDGNTVSNSDYDLMRNHLYRFEVKFPKIYLLEGGNVSAVEWHCRKK